MVEPACLVVARFLRAHGLKGDALVTSLTDQPETTFAAGRRLEEVDEAGVSSGAGLTLVRSRPLRQAWLLRFSEIGSRSALEQRGLNYLGGRREELRPLGANSMYLHEIPGAQVVERGEVIGVAREVVGGPGAELLVIEARGKEHLIPFRAPILRALDRAARRIEVDLPAGLLDL